MCGIFGAIGDATDEALDAACAALRHRGPDAHGAWREGRVGLAHTRLKVIDLSEAAAQPMAGCDPSVRVTFNGEIYNHRVLRAELEARGHRFRSRSDTEALVHGYEEWGARVVERLDGFFALGVWDGRTRRLLLARDRVGKKPLYYTLTSGGLRFASEVKALVRAGLSDTIDLDVLPHYLAWGYVPAPTTIHRGVRQLPPASRLVWEPATSGDSSDGSLGEPVVERYWQPTFGEAPLDVSAGEAKARVRELVVEAVERRLEADVPLGAFLSGGIDSTLIVGVLAKLLGKKVRTFSIGFAGRPDFDESAAARQTAACFGTEHTEFQLPAPRPDDLVHLVHLHDGPFADSSAIPTHAVARLTREHVTVALSGDGGDELFAGYLRLLAGEYTERVPAPLRSGLGALARLLPARLPGALAPHSLGARARRFLDAAALPLADRMARWNCAFAFELPALLRPELAARLDLSAPLAWHRSFFDGHAAARSSPLARILDHNFRAYLAEDLLPKVDRTSAGCALEVRSPFLDTALVEYAGRLPDRLRRRGTRTKWLLREAFADLIPEHVARRPKRGFGVPMGEWLRAELRPLLDLLGPSARIREFLCDEAVDALRDNHLAGRTDEGPRLFTLLTLELWLCSLSQPATPC